MNLEWVRRSCLAWPAVTEVVQWGDHLVFKVGGKVFAVAALDPSATALTLKCTPEEFAELCERPGCSAARYLTRGEWISLESFDTLPARDVLRLLRQSYDLIVSKLPRKLRPF